MSARSLFHRMNNKFLSPKATKSYKISTPDVKKYKQTPDKHKGKSTPEQNRLATPTKKSPIRRLKLPFKAVPSPQKPSPKKTPKKKKVQYDRFIPDRNTMDLASAHFNMNHSEQRLLEPEQIAYQEQMAKACGVALDARILSFNVEPPNCSRKKQWASTGNRVHKKMSRRIPIVPEKVLDAPGLLDDFYLNLLHWSSSNLLAVGLDKSVYIWNAEDGSVDEFCQTNENDYIASLQWAADGSYLAIGTGSGDTQIWDVDTCTKIRSMKGHISRVGVLSWDKHILSSGSRDGSIWNHDVRIAQHKVAELLGHSSEVCGLQWRPDGQLLASGGNDNQVQIWDARSTEPRSTKTNHMAAVKALAWCPWQLNLLATGGGQQDNMIHFWNTTTDTKTASVNAGSQITSIQWSREYKEFVSSHGFPNNHLTIWSYPSLNKIADLTGHDSRILSTALSPDGQTLASTASDENLKFWKVFETRKQKKVDDLEKSIQRMTIR